MAVQRDSVAVQVMHQQFSLLRVSGVGSFPSSPQQKVRIPSGQLFDEELGCMADIEQEFISGEYSGVNVDDLHRVQFEIRAFTANKSIKTKRIRPQRRRNRAAKLQKPFAFDVVRYVLMMEIFRSLVETAPQSASRTTGCLAATPKKSDGPAGLRVKDAPISR